jgi:hypothetical protein
MPLFVDKKPSVFNFDPATTYKNSERLDIYLITEKVNNSLRPKKQVIFKDFPESHKSIDFFHPGQEVVRNDINKYKKIPHKDYIPVYVPPYYNIKETGFSNMNHNNIFRSTAN